MNGRLLAILVGLFSLFAILGNSNLNSKPRVEYLNAVNMTPVLLETPALLATPASFAPPVLLTGQAEDPITDSASQSASKISETISTLEWLGPLAPIAMSPFFGITCLSGLSIFSDGMPWEGNAFISENSFLQNPMVFWVFLILTLVTSLPRLTKVSKPVAQALDQVETYGGIIILIVIRVFATTAQTDVPEQMVQVAGIFSLSIDTLMIIAMVINIIVINTVKFFFEVMVWLTPFPFVDAILEATNKAVCAILMTIYAFSPLLATILNLIIFVGCAIAFRWIYRRVTYARRLLTDPLVTMIFPGYGKVRKHLIVFPKNNFGPFPAKSKLHLSKVDSGWRLERRRLVLSAIVLDIPESETGQLTPGLLINRIQFLSISQSPLIFSRRHNLYTDELAERFELTPAKSKEDSVKGQLEMA